MGYRRAGWYSWDLLDNRGVTSAKTIHPEWQHLVLGDHIPTGPRARNWWLVAGLDPERFLGLRGSFNALGASFDPAVEQPFVYTDSLWGMQLKELLGGRTRLVVSGYWALRPRCLHGLASLFFLEPVHWIMIARQFRNLKQRAESSTTRH
jgi:proline iminopeptidase